MYTAHTKEDDPILTSNNKSHDNGDLNNISIRKITNSKNIYKGNNYLSIPNARETNNNNINLSNYSNNPSNNPNNNFNRDTSIELCK